MAPTKKSLRDLHPRRLDVPFLIFLALVILLAGLSLPILQVDKTVLWRHWQNRYSVLRSLTEVQPQVGVYLFGAAIILSMLTTMHVERIARRTRKAS